MYFAYIYDLSIAHPKKRYCQKENGFCVLPNGHDQNSGVIKLDAVNGNSPKQQASCLARCLAYPGATGCEEIWNQGNRGCYVHTSVVSRGNGVRNHACWILNKCAGTFNYFKVNTVDKPLYYLFKTV